MKPRIVLSSLLLAALLVVAYCLIARVTTASGGSVTPPPPGKITQGSLQVIDPEKGAVVAECPLKRTDVKAEISGFLARVVLTQEFENPFKDKIEAVYTFPLPHNAAVDDMTMLVGDRTVRGKIKRREEARAVYEAAREAGQVASLLDQERPNIFTQSVANIMPGEKVKIIISYVDWLKYEDGSYEFVFPMVVGPRYIPGNPIGKQGGGWAPDTTQVPDASKVTPPVTPQGTRAGHDISVEVALDAGVPIDALTSVSHDVDVDRRTIHSAVVGLKNKSEIPNKDFILKYDVAGKQIQDALMTYKSGDKGFFTMILQPPERVAAPDVMPKELVFVLDTSGSMMGFPIEKAKECMKLALDGLYPQDTFNLITFSGVTHVLFPEPVPATRENLDKAQKFLASRSGSGGTEMMKAIKAALDPSDAQNHIRIVCFMTDGYVGNDLQIISEVQNHPNARVFSFGIGNSANRFLLDKMAEHGRGEVEYVTLNDDGSAAARRFHERVRNPLLTDVSLDWGGLKVDEVYPQRIPDLFSAKPVVITGQYAAPGNGTIKLKGRYAGRDFVKELPVELPAQQPRHDVLATLWARSKISDLMSKDYDGVQRGSPKPEVAEAITQLGLDYRLMTQFTSFVAVEEMSITDGGQPRRIDVPVEMPSGVSYQGTFGGERKELARRVSGPMLRSSPVAETVAVTGGGGGGGRNTAARRSPPVKASPPEAKKGAGGGNAASASGMAPAQGQSEPPLRLSQLGGSADRSKPLTPEEQRQRLIASKLHPALLSIVDRLKSNNSNPTSAEAAIVRNGKAEIRILVSNKSPETLAALKAIGFEIMLEPKSAKMLIGRLPIEKLEALGDIAAVTYAAPIT